MTDKYTLENILSDDGFYEIVKERLKEWDSRENKDFTDPDFITIWSATDYRIKQHRALSNKEEQSEALMKLFAEHSFYPHTQVSGPPVIKLYDLEMSPKGDLSISEDRVYHSDNKGTETYLTIYATGEMRPLTMIYTGRTNMEHHKFSHNSRYIALLTDDLLRIWDIFQIKIVREIKVENVQPYSQLSWSSDSSHLLYTTEDKSCVINMNDDKTSYVDIENYLTTTLDRAGNIIMTITNKTIRFFDVNKNELLSEYDFPTPYFDETISFYCNDSFYTIASGKIIQSTPENGTFIIKDHSDILELSTKMRKYIDSLSETDNKTYFYEEFIKIENNSLIYHYPTNYSSAECKVNLNDNSIELYSSDNNQILSYSPYTSLPKELMDQAVTLVEEKTDTDHFYIFDNDKIIEFKKIDSKGRISIYAYRQFIFKIRLNSIVNDRYVTETFMDYIIKKFGEISHPKDQTKSEENKDFDYLIDEDGAEYIKYYDDILITPGILLYTDHTFRMSEHNAYWYKCVNEGFTTYVCSQSLNYCNSEGINKQYLPCITNGYPQLIECQFKKLPKVNDDLLFYIDNNIYRINLLRESLDCIITKDQITEEFGTNKIEKIIGDESFMLVSYNSDRSTDLALISNGNIKKIDSKVGTNSFVLHGRMIYYAKDGCLYSINDSKKTLIADLDDRHKWTIMGINDNGTISLSKFDIHTRTNISKSVKMHLARLSPPNFDLDVFENGNFFIEDTDNISHSIDIKGNRMVFRDTSDNPFRRFRANNCVIKRTGVRKGNTLMPDTSSFNCSYKQISDSLCLYMSDSAYADNNKKIEIRPMMRLIDLRTGKMVRRKELKHTEGIMYGPRTFSIRNSENIVLLDNDQYIAIEFKTDNRFIIMSWDISSGKQYPIDGKSIDSPMIYSDDNTVTVGLIDQSTNKIDTLYKLTPKLEKIQDSEIKLNVPMINSYGTVCYESMTLRTELQLYNYSYNGNQLMKAFRHAGYYHENSDIKSIVPLIIPMEISEGYMSEEYPQPIHCYDINDDVWLFDIDTILCTLQYGMIENEIPYRLTIAYDKNNKEQCLSELVDSVQIVFYNGSYYIAQPIRMDSGKNRKGFTNRLIKVNRSGSEIVYEDLFYSQHNFATNGALKRSKCGISFTRFKDNDNLHCLLNDEGEQMITVSYGNKDLLTSVFFDGILSITYDEKSKFITIIKEKESKTLYYMDYPIITDLQISKNGDYQFTLDKSVYNKMIIPKDIKKTELIYARENDKEKLYNQQHSNVFTCHGLFGYTE